MLKYFPDAANFPPNNHRDLERTISHGGEPLYRFLRLLWIAAIPYHTGTRVDISR